MRRLSTFILYLLAVVVATVACSSSQRGLEPVQNTEGPASRVALVIGNSSYNSISDLANPANDARAMAQTLRARGFDVVMRTDLDKMAMDDAVTEFVRRIEPGAVALFYYAGHGISVDNHNYLLSTEAREGAILDRSIVVSDVLNRANKKSPLFNLLILDACRDDPFGSYRSAGAPSGWTDVVGDGGMYVIYGTAPGQRADDNRRGSNGLFTQSLLEHMSKPGLELRELAYQVREDVYQASGGQQRPSSSDSYIGKFYFTPSETARNRSEASSSPVSDRTENVAKNRALKYVQHMQNGIDAFNQAQQSDDSADFMRAAAHFRSAAAVEPDSADAHLNEAYAWLNAGQRQEAIPALERYISKTSSVSATVYTILGQIYLTDDQTEKAITLLEEATEQYPENEEMQSLLLNAFNQIGDTERAMQAYREQIEKNPNNAQFRYNYGSMLLNADRYDDAIEQLRKASEIRSDDAKIFYNLGAAHINKAAAIDDSITTIEDRAREADREVTSEEEAMLDDMVQQRRTQFSEAIPPLEKALQLSESGSQYRTDICRALFQAYVNTEQDEKASRLERCAGFTPNSVD